MVRRAVNVLLLKSEMILLIFVSYLLGEKNNNSYKQESLEEQNKYLQLS